MHKVRPCGALLALVLGLVVAPVIGPRPGAAAQDGGPRIAVLEFQNGGAAGDLDALGKGLQSMVTTDLSQVPALRLVERARLQEIQSELKLGKSGMVDGKTAARLGKLAGATHLLTGSFAVVGGKMRLDSRLFSVERGDVLAAEKIEGDKDAFFDLEKALVAKLIETVGVKLQPKERVAVTRVHTTDFEAFRKFSQGVQAFDDKRYDEALAALREAGNRDKDFKLAAVTLGEYEGVITRLRARADEIQAAEAQIERLKQDKDVKAQAAVVERLYGIAAQGSRQDRLVALHALALFYGYQDGYGHHEKLKRVQDEFAMQRTADTLWKSYFAGAAEVAPLMPILVTVNLSGQMLSTPDKFDEDFKQLTTYMLDLNQGGFKRHYTEIANDIVHVEELARRLQRDKRGECQLRDTVLRLVEKLEPPQEYRNGWQRDTAICLRAVGEYGRSTALLSAVGASEKEPWRIKATADEIAKNRDLEQILAKAKRKQPLLEFMTLGAGAWSDSPFVETCAGLGSGERPSPRDLHRLSTARRVKEGGYVLIGDVPVWMVRGGEAYRDDTVVTGPRTDPLRGRELRYYRDQPDAEALAVLDGVPRRELQARFEVAFAPAEDYWPPKVSPGKAMTTLADARMVARRPEVGLAFALRDIEAEGRPLRALELVLAEDAVRLVDLTQADPRKPAAVRVLGERKIDLRSARSLDVSVRIGAAAEVTVNGQSASLPINQGSPAERMGFYGLHLRGPGYAAVRGIKVSGKGG